MYILNKSFLRKIFVLLFLFLITVAVSTKAFADDLIFTPSPWQLAKLPLNSSLNLDFSSGEFIPGQQDSIQRVSIIVLSNDNPFWDSDKAAVYLTEGEKERYYSPIPGNFFGPPQSRWFFITFSRLASFSSCTVKVILKGAIVPTANLYFYTSNGIYKNTKIGFGYYDTVSYTFKLGQPGDSITLVILNSPSDSGPNMVSNWRSLDYKIEVSGNP
ncbi:hypothetical protein Thena_0751 [Thermodesulfobium narugense DSM 14796]|uniref:Uncharacterized protein n=1 Tax=Thermodesulfobium narugense DSM 14796 TaxID=747365 RepID=M1E7B3_9BACT|nr:hypothetical protein [Thermodesulfobium narugense]AEE14385.1 hypothetical protein Thena_0751 [Thermodesulfobium narugense DSM 14796]